MSSAAIVGEIPEMQSHFVRCTFLNTFAWIVRLLLVCPACGPLRGGWNNEFLEDLLWMV
jgi:hypothetical protein